MKHDKLPKGFKKRWLRALRSGKFIQGEGYLKVSDDDGVIKHCCLGVACEIAGAIVPYRKHKIALIENERVAKIKGITKVPASLHGFEDTASQLSTMNDSGDGFNVIANWIEKNL